MKNPSEYLKMRVLGAVDMAEGDTIRDRMKAVSEMKFVDDDGYMRNFTWRTIETWRSRYNKHGITALTANERCDKGKPRKMGAEEVMEVVRAVMPKFHGKKINKSAIYRMAIEDGLITRSRIALNTFSRMLCHYEMLKPEDESTNKRRMAFSKAHANEMWQADTMFGPHVGSGKGKVQGKLIAFIDDASRVCCHGEFFKDDTADSLLSAFRSAFYKRGIPEILYVDNGSNYTSKEIVQVCARVGCVLAHTPIRDGAAKGKIERFFRTVRDQFLVRELDLSSLNTLNRQFTSWVEESYNAGTHSILGMSPLDRFALDRRRIRYLPPNEVNDELFFVEESRVTKADNTFPLKNVRYEAPRYLPSRKIQLRYARNNMHAKVVVFYRGERMGQARRLDMIANDRPPKAIRVKQNIQKGI